MEIVDYNEMQVLLIGSSTFPKYTSITPIPNVLANISDLKSTLTDANLIGIPEKNITISINENKIAIEKKLRGIITRTKSKTQSLLIYYTGHGILSTEEYVLYLPTSDTSKEDLEIEGVNIETFKRYIKQSNAGRKIVILDCCHGGAIIGAMNDVSSTIQAEIRKIEGTYVITSAAENSPALFPVETPDKPTYFTGRLIDIANEGLDIEREYCTLRDIFNKIDDDFLHANLPRPQQSNINRGDEFYFVKNRKFRKEDEIEWGKALLKNTKSGFHNFKSLYPESIFAEEAKNKIFAIEDDDCWRTTIRKNTISSFDYYLENYTTGKYIAEAKSKLKQLLNEEETRNKEDDLWQEVLHSNLIESYQKYLHSYPDGRYQNEAESIIKTIGIEKEKKQRQENIDEPEAAIKSKITFYENPDKKDENPGRFLVEEVIIDPPVKVNKVVLFLAFFLLLLILLTYLFFQK